MIRDRNSDDLRQCVDLLAKVHRHDRYPLHWPADPLRWLCPRNFLHAWVATVDSDAVVGHVAIRGAASGEVQPAAEVCRLFVAPAFRRDQVATKLLDHVRNWATERRTDLVLEVVDSERSPAIALYERTGWRHTHTATANWTEPNGGPVPLHRYMPPVSKRTDT